MGALSLRRVVGAAATITLLTLFSWPAFAGPRPRLDRALTARAGQPGSSRVIVRAAAGKDASTTVRIHRGRPGARLALVGAYVAEVPNDALSALAADPDVESVHLDRPVAPLLAPGGESAASAASGAVRTGFDGAGVGVAVIDSGVTGWHDDLARVDNGRALVGQRIVGFADFTSTTAGVADGYGHGTHVAGIVSGSGYDSDGAHAGVAPGAHLLVLKVLDAQGHGYVSDVIRALDFAIATRARFNLRVVNLSIGAPVLESYETDPLTLAALRAVEAGLVVVAAAGNLGKNAQDELQYGGITAPGNAPWVLTVGAYSHMGTVETGDDRVAGYSSRGPTAVDFTAKPDLVAPGTRIVSLNDGDSVLATQFPHELVAGTRGNGLPYLTLSGTSMAAPVVSGVVAQMLQANPGLTPNAVKAILQYTSAFTPDVDVLSQGAGFLNAGGAVSLSRFFATARQGDVFPSDPAWSAQIIWGNQLVSGGVLQPWGTAWGSNVIWGSTEDNVIWGSACEGDCDNVIWGSGVDNVIWGSTKDNVIWGSAKDNVIWGSNGDNVIWGSGVENVIWGSSKDNVIWGSSEGNVVWGTACNGRDCDNVIWGSAEDNVIWGSADNVIWGSGEDNVIWGSGEDNVIWGSADDNVIWGSSVDNVIWGSTVIAGQRLAGEPGGTAWPLGASAALGGH
jgi:serine protease AprX